MLKVILMFVFISGTYCNDMCYVPCTEWCPSTTGSVTTETNIVGNSSSESSVTESGTTVNVGGSQIPYVENVHNGCALLFTKCGKDSDCCSEYCVPTWNHCLFNPKVKLPNEGKLCLQISEKCSLNEECCSGVCNISTNLCHDLLKNVFESNDLQMNTNVPPVVTEDPPKSKEDPPIVTEDPPVITKDTGESYRFSTQQSTGVTSENYDVAKSSFHESLPVTNSENIKSYTTTTIRRVTSHSSDQEVIPSSYSSTTTQSCTEDSAWCNTDSTCCSGFCNVDTRRCESTGYNKFESKLITHTPIIEQSFTEGTTTQRNVEFSNQHGIESSTTSTRHESETYVNGDFETTPFYDETTGTLEGKYGVPESTTHNEYNGAFSSEKNGISNIETTTSYYNQGETQHEVQTPTTFFPEKSSTTPHHVFIPKEETHTTTSYTQHTIEKQQTPGEETTTQHNVETHPSNEGKKEVSTPSPQQQNILINSTSKSNSSIPSCLLTYQKCSKDDECCSGKCDEESEKCACLLGMQMCTSNLDCCSNVCDNETKTCMLQYKQPFTTTSQALKELVSPYNETCMENLSPCRISSHCCTNYCDNETRHCANIPSPSTTMSSITSTMGSVFSCKNMFVRRNSTKSNSTSVSDSPVAIHVEDAAYATIGLYLISALILILK